ncbi:hypothetical protein ACFQY5_07775 [Paeniroseomonas aquatica]|uniref:hypothetical protein n=1 Tax=Paeniroseomonas aquatica TaxID=373043 RepID=UPI003613208E
MTSGGGRGLTGTLDLVRSADDEMMVMARETGVALRQRLRLCAAAWGGPTAEHDAAELADMLLGSPASPGCASTWTGWLRAPCSPPPSCRWR